MTRLWCEVRAVVDDWQRTRRIRHYQQRRDVLADNWPRDWNRW